jgi:hypothetical protein
VSLIESLHLKRITCYRLIRLIGPLHLITLHLAISAKTKPPLPSGLASPRPHASTLRRRTRSDAAASPGPARRRRQPLHAGANRWELRSLRRACGPTSHGTHGGAARQRRGHGARDLARCSWHCRGAPLRLRASLGGAGQADP